MWYGLIDGRIYFETKAKSQKAVNLRRDPRCSVMIEAGTTYDQLRGVAIEGTATIIDDTTSDEYWAAAVSVFERYNGPYSDEMRPFVESGCVQSVVLWNPVDLGYAAVMITRAIVDGEFAPGDTTVSAGKLGDLAVVNGSEVLLGAPFIFNAENIGDFDF
jgi:hypothetical protein